MDAAYDAEAHHLQSCALGHVAIIDPNFRVDHARKAVWAAEVKRCSLVDMPDFDDVL
ncbi:hypothetical protein [uncultured Rhodoblastus sp.]|uniref:hypothetical protein n=1 Tax=uncultured Rhodoblastus sp. TaxID=543037 RepID=UPI0025F1F073|nr:hypothetical protein [uncultured Rhodoblastus sp.]